MKTEDYYSCKSAVYFSSGLLIGKAAGFKMSRSVEKLSEATPLLPKALEHLTLG